MAYDGADQARAALDDLLRAGLPREGRALIVAAEIGKAIRSAS